MKLNWGSGIAIFYTLFVIVMVGLVVYSKSFDNSLVVDNYYEEDIKYQGHIDRVKNSQALGEDLNIISDANAQAIRFNFPQNFRQIEGEIWFYRADDKSKDFKIAIHADSNGQVSVPITGLLAGKWTIKVNWEGDGTLYYKEGSVLF